jgi:hypothetical protein
MTELSHAASGADCHGPAIDARKFARQLGRERGDRLERYVPAARRDPNGLAQHLTTIGTDVHVGAGRAKCGGQQGADCRLLALCKAGMPVNDRE